MNPADTQFDKRLKKLEEENRRLKEIVLSIFQEEFKSIFDGFKGPNDSLATAQEITVTISGVDSGGDLFEGSDSISVDTLQTPDDFILFRYNGKKLKIPLYNA